MHLQCSGYSFEMKEEEGFRSNLGLLTFGLLDLRKGSFRELIVSLLIYAKVEGLFCRLKKFTYIWSIPSVDEE